MKAVLDSSPNAIILSKATGEILFLNKRFFEIFGNYYTRTNNIFDFYSLTITGYEEIKTVTQFYDELFDKKDKRELVNQHLMDKDGKIRHCDIQTSFIGKFDDVELFLTIIRDETYTKELEEKFYQSQKLESIGRLAGGIAHDFNNFLTAINGFAFLSLMNIENKQEVEKNLKKIIKNVYLDDIYIKNHPNVVKGEYVLLVVEDNGTGMSEEIKSHLFEPFYTTKEKGRGTGLGLATVYGIVKQNNGYIWCYSELGLGTVFKIYLPRCLEKYEERKKEPIFQHMESTVAEDDDMIREFIKRTLTHCRYRVLTAENGFKALDIMLENRDVDLLLTDIVMPEMSGLELAEKVKRIKPDIKILMMSGYSEELLLEKERYKEGYPLLLKPFTAIKLIETI